MALAQPTPIFESIFLPPVNNSTIRVELAFFTVPGPVSSFAVLDIYPLTIPDALPLIKANGKRIPSGRGIVVPGGASITVEYSAAHALTSSPTILASNYVTISGLFYKAS